MEIFNFLVILGLIVYSYINVNAGSNKVFAFTKLVLIWSVALPLLYPHEAVNQGLDSKTFLIVLVLALFAAHSLSTSTVASAVKEYDSLASRFKAYNLLKSKLQRSNENVKENNYQPKGSSPRYTGNLARATTEDKASSKSGECIEGIFEVFIEDGHS